MFIDIVTATVPANPTITLQPCDDPVPVCFQRWHGALFLRKYMRNFTSNQRPNVQRFDLGLGQDASPLLRSF
jgi:hypothetical protein